MQVDVAAAGRAERAQLLIRRPVADRATVDGFGGWLGDLRRFVGHRSLFKHGGGRMHPAAQAWRRFPSAIRPPGRLSLRVQTPTVLSQPKRIGKPSPPSRLTVSYNGRPTTLL